jgi:ligand-binding sensor domain-containing protein
VLDAAVDQRGYIWFATTEAIEVWDGTAMRTYSPTVIPPGTKVYSLLGQDDSMWVGTDKGLLRYQHFQWQVILPDMVVNAIIPDENGSGLLLGTDQGLVRYENGQSFLWIFNLGNEIIKNPKVTSVAWDGNHHLWTGTAGQGLFNYDGTHWQQFNSATGLPTDNIRKIYTDQLGSIWIAAVTGKSGGALVRFTP